MFGKKYFRLHFLYILVLIFFITSCNKKEVDSVNENLGLKSNSAENETIVSREFISTEKQQYFIRSNTDFEGNEMEILKLDTNPYTAIELIGWSNNGLFAYRTRHMHDSGMWGGWIYSLIVLNTINDEIIERESFIVGDAANKENIL